MAKVYNRYGMYEEELRYIRDEIVTRFPDIYENEEFLELIEDLE